ncbi:hypothetical protein ACIA5C_45925 [Actinoplanes sp. NPDC051343]|uniref:hypothetical protein n=1 Tax=Actinoplanes sp. NPDC051343 TaxID=3363906 RepID=UPI00379B5436
MMFVLAGISIAAHHHWRAVIATEDIPIITGWFSVASTTLAYLSAKASKAAADDSRRALLLHFRPESVRAAFSVRDPRSPEAQMPYMKVSSPAPLWLTLTPRGQNPAETYTVVWVGDDNVPSARREVVLEPGRDEYLQLVGVAAEEDTSGAIRQTVAALSRLTIECRDNQMKAKWVKTRRWPERGALGSYLFESELDE